MEIKNKFKDGNANVPNFTLGPNKPQVISGVIFLDRDGVVIENIKRNGVEGSARNLSEIRLVENIDLLISSLRRKNIISVVVTNQPDIARGKIDQNSTKLIHEYLCEKLGINLIVWCPHDDKDSCSCRKPKNGMIKFAHNKLKIKNIFAQILIGDRISDMICAQKSNIPALHFFRDSECECSAIKHFKSFDEIMISEIIEKFQ